MSYCMVFDSFVVLLSGILTMIIVRTLRRDIAKYNKIDEEVCCSFLIHARK